MAAAPACVADAVEWFRKRFRPDAARGLCVAYRIELSGPGAEVGAGEPPVPSVLSVRVDDGRLELDPEGRGAADVTYRLSADDFYGVLAGTANPDLLFMAERITIEGDLSLALKLRGLFSQPA